MNIEKLTDDQELSKQARVAFFAGTDKIKIKHQPEQFLLLNPGAVPDLINPYK